MANKTFKEWLEENPRECLSMAYNEYLEEQAKIVVKKTVKPVKRKGTIK